MSSRRARTNGGGTMPGRRRARSEKIALLPCRADGCRFEPPADAAPTFDEYVSDPAKPVPFIPNIAIGMTREHMVDDQRFASTRPDVLVYQTDVLEEDVTIAGPITAAAARLDHRHRFRLGREADRRLLGRLSRIPSPIPAGVQMGGYQQLVRGEVMRGKFRNSFEKPEPFEPGKVDERRVRDARRLSHVPPRASHHGPGAKLLVPARRSQSAEVLRHLPRPRRGFSEGDAAHLSGRRDGFADSADGAGAVTVRVSVEERINRWLNSTSLTIMTSTISWQL